MNDRARCLHKRASTVPDRTGWLSSVLQVSQIAGVDAEVFEGAVGRSESQTTTLPADDQVLAVGLGDLASAPHAAIRAARAFDQDEVGQMAPPDRRGVRPG